MRINIVGAGPAGLFFASMMKKSFPDYVIRLFEQNGADATFGFGVVLSSRALHYLAQGDADLMRRLFRKMESWTDQHIIHRGETVVIDGSSYAAIERMTLLKELQVTCGAVGVQLNFNHRIDDPSVVEDCDILVGADGANSLIRDRHSEAFGTRKTDLANFYAWYGVDHPYVAHSLTFKHEARGIFCGHHYRYRPDRSTFVAEVDNDTWHSSGMYAMSNEERQKLIEEVFIDTLSGHRLLNNRSIWRRYRLVDNDRWHFGKIVLIGDALRSAHPSIGSGTRLAIEDSIALWRAFQKEDDRPEQIFARYQTERQPVRNKLNRAAELSIAWYEQIAEKIALAPFEFAYDYALRTGIMTSERLRAESPLFHDRYRRSVFAEAEAVA
jgi:2-polyprenyl-6-methoxyphenol hydroxylase-like FAD-dependent oxidoreductase